MDEDNIRINLEQLRSGFNQLNRVTNSTEFIEGFDTVKNYSEFIDIYSEVSWDSIYRTKQELSSNFSDILFGLREGQVFGPYKDGNFYKISRMIDKKREDNLNKVLIADVVKEIIPSNESSNENYRKASQAEFDANNNLALNYSDANLVINEFESFESFDEGLPSINNSRQVIKWIYEKGSRVGDVKRFDLTDGYIVAKITDLNKKRLPSIEDIRDEISQILSRNKKFKYLSDKYKKNVNIDNIAEEFSLEIENASAVTQYDPILVGAGVEPYIIGSSFSLDIDEVSDLLKGNSGVFIVKLLSKDFATEVDLVQEISNSLTNQELQRIATLIIEVIESKAEIVDNRSFYY